MTAVRELPVRRISVPPIYTQVPRYVDYWPQPPELDFVLYRIESPHWSGDIKVRKILLDNYGEERAVPFTVWGFLLKEIGDAWQPLFDRYGRHEVRKAFIESIRYQRNT
jgi:hypothetical protein